MSLHDDWVHWPKDCWVESNFCVFCGLLESGDARWVAQWPEAVAFLPLPESVLALGHTVVAPRTHSLGVMDAPISDLGPTAELVQAASRSMIKALGASGVVLLNASGPGSGQTVGQLRYHVVPRWLDDDDSSLPWPETRSPRQIAGDVAQLLAPAM